MLPMLVCLDFANCILFWDQRDTLMFSSIDFSQVIDEVMIDKMCCQFTALYHSFSSPADD